MLEKLEIKLFKKVIYIYKFFLINNFWLIRTVFVKLINFYKNMIENDQEE